MSQPRFSKVHLEISNVCNLQCSFCPEVIREKKLMSPELFRHALKEVAPLAEQIALHLMGDPLVHPRLGQLIDQISNIQVGSADARAKDVLGRVYEYFLSQFASAFET